MDQPVTFSARVELLHALARSRSATVGDLHRLALTQNLGRNYCRIVFRHPFNLCALGAELRLRRLRECSMDRGDLLWTQTGGDGDRHRRRRSHRKASVVERSDVGDRRCRVYLNLLFQGAVPHDHLGCRCHWLGRRKIVERKVRCGVIEYGR